MLTVAAATPTTAAAATTTATAAAPAPAPAGGVAGAPVRITLPPRVRGKAVPSTGMVAQIWNGNVLASVESFEGRDLDVIEREITLAPHLPPAPHQGGHLGGIIPALLAHAI